MQIQTVRINMDNFSRAVKSINPTFLTPKTSTSDDGDRSCQAQQEVQENAVADGEPSAGKIHEHQFVDAGEAAAAGAVALAEANAKAQKGPSFLRTRSGGGVSSTGSVRSSSDLELKILAGFQNLQPSRT